MVTRCAIDQVECIENTQPLPQRVKVCSISGFALLSYGEEPCPLRLQTVFSTLNLIYPETPPEFCPSRKWRCFQVRFFSKIDIFLSLFLFFGNKLVNLNSLKSHKRLIQNSL